MNQKKRTYERPSMKVYEMRRRAQLLTGSGGQGGVNNYTWQNVDEE